MPSCKFFLEGLCTKGDDCPYRHVKVNESADVCPDYLKGFCPAAAECKKRHVNVCPQFESRGACPRGDRCPLPHNAKIPGVPKTGRKAAAPAKPKRKSVGEASTVKKQRTARYYEEDHKGGSARGAEKASSDEQLVRDIVMENASSSSSSLAADAMEAKRKRLLRKVELAKQGWTGVAAVSEPSRPLVQGSGDLDDSGPYEEIDEEEEEEDGDDNAAADDTVLRRPPVGELPSFIPLSKDSDEDGCGDSVAVEGGDAKGGACATAAEEEFEERLI